MADCIYSVLCAIWEYMVCIYRDFLGALFFKRTSKYLANVVGKKITVGDAFREIVRKTPNKACMLFNDQAWTFQEVEDYSKKVASVFSARFNLKKGDCVSLFMENKPEYVGIWLGLSKIGVITALVNTNLRGDSLLHTIKVAKSKCVIYGSNLESG
jgi:solute carrier family 27 fatty acid transporter 1/4